MTTTGLSFWSRRGDSGDSGDSGVLGSTATLFPFSGPDFLLVTNIRSGDLEVLMGREFAGWSGVLGFTHRILEFVINGL